MILATLHKYSQIFWVNRFVNSSLFISISMTCSWYFTKNFSLTYIQKKKKRKIWSIVKKKIFVEMWVKLRGNLQARRRGGSGGSVEPPLKFYSSEQTPFEANELTPFKQMNPPKKKKPSSVKKVLKILFSKKVLSSEKNSLF